MHALLSSHIPRWALIVSTLAILAVGCGDDPPGNTSPVAPTNGNTTTTDTTPTSTTATNTGTTDTSETGTTATAPARLERIDDQIRSMNASSRLELSVRFINPDGSPGSNTNINWEIIGEAEDTGLGALQSVTDNEGIARMDVNSGVRQSNFDVIASVDGDPDVEPVAFTVNVQSKEFAAYTVRVRYENGVRDYTNNKIKTILLTTPESCDDLDPLKIGAPGSGTQVFRADERRPGASFPPEMTVPFNNLRNDSQYTVVALGLADDNGQVIGSWGCNDVRPVIEDGVDPEPIIVEMNDFLPNTSGVWEITSEFNLTEALPDGVNQYLQPLLNFFSDPAGTLTEILLDFAVGQGLNIESARTLIEGIAEDLLSSLIDSNDFVSDFVTGGGDISDILRNFKLQGLITIPQDSINDDGTFADVNLVYNRFGYRWRLQCTDDDFDQNPSCGDSFVDFSRTNLNPIQAVISGAVIPSSDLANGWNHELFITQHPLDLNYGEIIVYLIENLVLPLLFDDLEEYSLRGLLTRFIDCEDLFEEGLFRSVCETGIDEVSNLAIGFVTDQSLQYERFTVGTPDTNACALYERDDADYGVPPQGQTAHLPKFEKMGKDPDLTDADLRCLWDANIQFSDDPNDATQFTGKWFGQWLQEAN